jgi:hypothetical protein
MIKTVMSEGWQSIIYDFEKDEYKIVKPKKTFKEILCDCGSIWWSIGTPTATTIWLIYMYSSKLAMMFGL